MLKFGVKELYIPDEMLVSIDLSRLVIVFEYDAMKCASKLTLGWTE